MFYGAIAEMAAATINELNRDLFAKNKLDELAKQIITNGHGLNALVYKVHEDGTLNISHIPAEGLYDDQPPVT